MKVMHQNKTLMKKVLRDEPVEKGLVEKTPAADKAKLPPKMPKQNISAAAPTIQSMSDLNLSQSKLSQG